MGRENSRSRSPARKRYGSRSKSLRRKGGRGRSDSRDRGKKQTGYVVTWNIEKGFGFVKPDRGGNDLFVHVSGLKDGDALREGDEVTYEKAWDDRHDKYRAENVFGAVRESDIRNSRRYRGRSDSRRNSRRRGSRSRGRGGGREVCRQYQRRGSCDWGDRCRFQH